MQLPAACVLWTTAISRIFRRASSNVEREVDNPIYGDVVTTFTNGELIMNNSIYGNDESGDFVHTVHDEETMHEFANPIYGTGEYNTWISHRILNKNALL